MSSLELLVSMFWLTRWGGVFALVVALFVSNTVWAIGLGDVSSTPFLGEPLQIQIAVTGVGARPLEAECAVLQKNPGGIAPEYFPRDASIHLDRSSAGGVYLVVVSRTAIQQPVVEFRVTLNCGYDVSRDYVLLPSLRRDYAVSPVAPVSSPSSVAIRPSQGGGQPAPAPQNLPDGMASTSVSLDRDMTLEALGQKYYGGQPMRRARFVRWVYEANQSLFPGSGDPRQHVLSAGTQLLLPVGVPPRRIGDQQSDATPDIDPRTSASRPVPSPQPKPQPPSQEKPQLPASTARKPSPSSDRLVLSSGGRAPLLSSKETEALISRLTGMLEQQLASQAESQQRIVQLEGALADLSKLVVESDAKSREQDERWKLERLALTKMMQERSEQNWWQLVAAILGGGVLGGGILVIYQRISRQQSERYAELFAPASNLSPRKEESGGEDQLLSNIHLAVDASNKDLPGVSKVSGSQSPATSVLSSETERNHRFKPRESVRSFADSSAKQVEGLHVDFIPPTSMAELDNSADQPELDGISVPPIPASFESSRFKVTTLDASSTVSLDAVPGADFVIEPPHASPLPKTPELPLVATENFPKPDVNGLPSMDNGAGGSEDDDEIAAKLELAQAYEEIGDREGACDLLHEVINEGGDELRLAAEAQLMELSAKPLPNPLDLASIWGEASKDSGK